MLDPTAQVTVGGALLLVIYMLLKFKPWKNGNQQQRELEAGKISVQEWEGRMLALMQKANEQQMEDFRALLDTRTAMMLEKIRDPVIAAIDKNRHDARNIVGEAIAKAYLLGKGKDVI